MVFNLTWEMFIRESWAVAQPKAGDVPASALRALLAQGLAGSAASVPIFKRKSCTEGCQGLGYRWTD